MFTNTKAFSGFSVDDIVEARRFYSESGPGRRRG
jgi:hypothetical protein